VITHWLLKNKRPTWCHLLFYSTSYVLSMFRTLIYPSSWACDYSVELPHWSNCSWFNVCWSFGVVGLEWYPCCRLKPVLENKRPAWCHLLFCFTSYLLNMFQALIHPSSGACDYSVELPHWSYCSWFDVCWSFGAVGLEWYPCCRHKLLFVLR